ncbi:MOSC domain-containing protein [Arenimonas soli]|uniref:MOSC domain-containing protein n=1 Tax=Arenimonas soli TaxID=2269504 RepID=A0ABQ1HTH6_9GAMM|nr:MOSC domain-containing protein [Arenimonas soli]GGA87550.1 MOSC domain-containing protein [Arenimonas soli]
MATLSAIHVYPVKSCAGLAFESARVLPRGLEHDRRWMLVDPDGKFLTARQLPPLLQVRAVPAGDGLHLQAPGMPPLELGAGDLAEALPVQVWKSHVVARAAGPGADAWFSRYLGRPVRLVHMGPGEVRQVTSSRGQAGDEVSFADAMPLLLVSRAALDALNQRLDQPVPMNRFRPNLVVDGVDAHAEDGWKQVSIGDVVFDVAKPCTRCVLVTIDADTGQRHEGGEPLRTLTRYRRGEDGVTFGQLLIPRSRGVVRRGDAVVVRAQA